MLIFFDEPDSFNIKLKVLSKRLFREGPKLNHKAKKLHKNIIRLRQEGDFESSFSLAKIYLSLKSKIDIINKIASILEKISENISINKEEGLIMNTNEIIQITKILKNYLSEGILKKLLWLPKINSDNLEDIEGVSLENLIGYQSNAISHNYIEKFLKKIDETISRI